VISSWDHRGLLLYTISRARNSALNEQQDSFPMPSHRTKTLSSYTPLLEISESGSRRKQRRDFIASLLNEPIGCSARRQVLEGREVPPSQDRKELAGGDFSAWSGMHWNSTRFAPPFIA